MAIAALAVAGGVIWFSYYGPCGRTLVNRSIVEMRLVTERWTDVFEIANSTARISLAGPVQELQSIQRELEAQDIPTCLEPARNHLSKSMDNTIKAFLAFMSDEDNSVIETYFTQAKADIQRYLEAVDIIIACAPVCPPAPE